MHNLNALKLPTHGFKTFRHEVLKKMTESFKLIQYKIADFSLSTFGGLKKNI